MNIKKQPKKRALQLRLSATMNALGSFIILAELRRGYEILRSLISILSNLLYTYAKPAYQSNS